MATMTFTYSANYEQKFTEGSLLEPTVEYRLEIPENTNMLVDDVYYHVEAWLRSLGYVIPE